MCSTTMILKSNAIYDDILLLSWPDLSFRHASRKDMNCEIRLCGHYEFIDNTLVAIFRHLGALYLLYDSSLMPLADVQVQIEKRGKYIYLHIATDSYKFTIKQKFVSIRNDPTPLIDVEDFNFLIFLSNIIGSQSRQELLYQHC